MEPVTDTAILEIRRVVDNALKLLSQAATIQREPTIEELRERWSLIDNIDNSEVVKLTEELKVKEEQLDRLMAANLELHILWQHAQRDLVKRRSEEQVGTENEALRQEINRLRLELEAERRQEINP